MSPEVPIELVRYRASFEISDPLHLPDYPGSAWRGAFGHAVKAAACTRPGAACAACPECRDCPYPPLFETLDGAEPIRPYVLEPQVFSGYFLPGSLIGLDFVLMGWLNGWLPLLIDALHSVGQQGLGKRSPCRLALIGAQQQVGPGGEGWVSILQPGHPGLIGAPIEPLWIPAAPRQAHLDIITPLRFKYRGKFVEPSAFTAKDLLTALSRRIEACASLMTDLPLPPKPTTWFSGAESLIERAELAWLDTHHYSTRQHGALKLGGIIGHLLLHGPMLEQVWPWLWLGQWLHLGSSTTIGLGRYVVRAA